ncbi:hypothetical protein [Chryseobacterium hagamense]|uniref:Uncharacterized protein n=1 Tax=Chryseobacterium hagamense TaxID=395935 RepID=A0A511YNC0_9FLAO|nr:hypothetical protein [Chryseobacterium hagamense]GEN76694.1 hypothetical protein CHA01nite_24340 [Chryseobacterium hagamense]
MSCKPFETCFEFVKEKHSIVSFRDKKSSTKYIYKNNKKDELSKYRIDGCIINDNGSKCDYILINCTKKKVFFIELKGSDLVKAIEQIDRSLDLLLSYFEDYTIEARIVLTRVNTVDLKDIKLLKLENRIKNLKGQLIKQTRQLDETN